MNLSTSQIKEPKFRKITQKIVSEMKRLHVPGVSIGIYATVLFIYGMTERLADLADARFDATGLGLEQDNLPKRVRLR